MKQNEGRCNECGEPTENDGAACAGACASERYYGNDNVFLNTNGLPSCNCCDKCRNICNDSFTDTI